MRVKGKERACMGFECTNVRLPDYRTTRLPNMLTYSTRQRLGTGWMDERVDQVKYRQA